jgi:chemotaxis protein histidine kinase CheA
MARLKDLESPDEVLEAIRGGALKNEIIKKYRTSEQELARLLLPLYKSGDLTKEEFNDFFKGVPLRPRQTPAKLDEAKQPGAETEDEPPSQIFRSLAADQEPEPVKDEVAKPEEPLPTTEPDEELAEKLEEEIAEELEEQIAEDLEEEVVEEEETAEPELDISENALDEELEEELADEISETEEPVPVAAEEVETPESPAPTGAEEEVTTPIGMPVDSAGMTSVLEMLFARLGFIDNRLAKIEKKLGITED